MAGALGNGRARVAAAAVTVAVRVGVYCRKSTEENLDSAFNSLDAQREACQAYITSQKHEGWIAHAETFEDGGYSGGTLDRPALKRLLKAVETGEIQCVAVYRADRLSRRLLDFLQMVEFLDKHGCSFVSITEQFNTSTPGGRLYQHMLLSFAEYERALIGERTRHKLHAARKKGKHVGGGPVVGYDLDPRGGRLHVNKDEVPVVCEIFSVFLERRSLVETAAELTRRGITLKRWVTKDGKAYGGGRFDKVNLRRMLTNHVYIGKVLFEGQIYEGEHEGIVPVKVFREVQGILAEHKHDRHVTTPNGTGALLRGLLRCAACDRPMPHTWTKSKGRIFRYYTCQRALKEGHAACPTKALKADKVEAFVVNEIRRIGADPALQRATFEQAVAQVAAQRRGLKADTKRVERDLAATRAEVERLVATLSRTRGPAADAVGAELEKAQARVTTLDARLADVHAQEKTLAAQHVDEADVARALEAFDPIWDVLLTPERERVLRLLIAGIRYDGSTGKLDIDWRLAGFGELAQEVGGG